MGIYQDYVVPYLVHLSMRQARLTESRQRVVDEAKGHVLEIGVGSGMNLPLHTQDVTHVIGLDPSRKLLSFARISAHENGATVELLEATAQAVPLEDTPFAGGVDLIDDRCTDHGRGISPGASAHRVHASPEAVDTLVRGAARIVDS